MVTHYNSTQYEMVPHTGGDSLEKTLSPILLGPPILSECYWD